MLIKITNSCKMMCNHCCDDATPDGQHMSGDTFVKAVEMVKLIKPKFLLISGGEPTDHPEFFKMLDYLMEVYPPKVGDTQKCMFTIATNGLFLEDYHMRTKLLKYDVMIQITNDNRFYPEGIVLHKNKKIVYERHIRHILPLGRAQTNNLKTIGEELRKGTKCVNIRSATKSKGSIEDAVKYLESIQKSLCTPMIDEIGNVKAGEFRQCISMGTVWDSLDTISNNIITMKFGECNVCDGEKFLPTQIKDYLDNLGVK